MELVPCDFMPDATRNIFEDGLRESRWPCPADDLIKVESNVRELYVLLLSHFLEPHQNVFYKLQHDWLPWFAHEGPLAKGHALAAEDGMLKVSGLVDLNPDDHIYVHLVDPLGHKSRDRAERLNVDIGVDSSFNIHDKISQKISLDDVIFKRFVSVDDIRSGKPFWSKVLFNIRNIGIVRYYFVSEVRIDGRPAPCQFEISTFKCQRVSLPQLPDLAWEVRWF